MYIILLQDGEAKNKAESIYNNDAVISKLCSGYDWDTILNAVKIKNEADVINTEKGNYSGILYKTGKTVPVYNIYDMGGNVWEYTTEDYETFVGDRGGAFLEGYDSKANSMSSRSYADSNACDNYHGFRVTLFLK